MFQVLKETPALSRRLLLGIFLNALGGGLTMPLLIVYLHQIRGFSIFTAGMIIAWMSIFGLVGTGPVGAAIDRVGPKPVMVASIFVQSLATAGWGIVHHPYEAYLIGSLSAIGQSGLWPAQNTLMSRMVLPDKRQSIFGIQFMFLNLGLGLGGLISALIVDLHDPASFVRLYAIDGVSYLVYFAVIYSIPNFTADRTEEDGKSGSYLDLIKDRKLMYFFATSLVLMICGYGSFLETGIAPLVTAFAHQSAKVLGPIWALNTAVIVIGQLYFLKLLDGRSRSRLIQVICLLWAVSWLILGFSLKLPGYWPTIMAALAVGVFAIGEMVWSPVGPAIPNELAPEHLRGRYNALSSLNWTLAGSIGPAFGGFMLDRKLEYPWIGILILGCGVSAILAEKLRKQLSQAQDGLA